MCVCALFGERCAEERFSAYANLRIGLIEWWRGAPCRIACNGRIRVFDFAIVCYLFLGGLGGGLCAIASLATAGIPGRCLAEPFIRSYPRLLGTSFFAAAAILVLAGTVLLADAGISRALVYLFFPPSPNYLSIGSWLIVIATALCLVSGFMWRCGAAGANPMVLRLISVAGVLSGLGVALYTGLFLSAMPAVALWHTPWLPALFVLSSLSCGAVSFTALMKATDSHVRFRGFERVMLKADFIFAVLELVCAAGFLAASAVFAGEGSAAQSAASSAAALMYGDLAFAWWGAFVGFGVVALTVFDALILRAQDGWSGRLWMVMGPTFCAFAGAFALRYCIVEAGLHPVLGF